MPTAETLAPLTALATAREERAAALVLARAAVDAHATQLVALLAPDTEPSQEEQDLAGQRERYVEAPLPGGNLSEGSWRFQYRSHRHPVTGNPLNAGWWLVAPSGGLVEAPFSDQPSKASASDLRTYGRDLPALLELALRATRESTAALAALPGLLAGAPVPVPLADQLEAARADAKAANASCERAQADAEENRKDLEAARAELAALRLALRALVGAP